MSKKNKNAWVVTFTQDEEVEYFDGHTLDSCLKNAYVFDNFYLANTVMAHWNHQSGNEHYDIISVSVSVKKSTKITKVTS